MLSATGHPTAHHIAWAIIKMISCLLHTVASWAWQLHDNMITWVLRMCHSGLLSTGSRSVSLALRSSCCSSPPCVTEAPLSLADGFCHPWCYLSLGTQLAWMLPNRMRQRTGHNEHCWVHTRTEICPSGNQGGNSLQAAAGPTWVCRS